MIHAMKFREYHEHLTKSSTFEIHTMKFHGYHEHLWTKPSNLVRGEKQEYLSPEVITNFTRNMIQLQEMFLHF